MVMSWLGHATKGLRLFPPKLRFPAIGARYPPSSSSNTSKYDNEIKKKTATEGIHKQSFSVPSLPTPNVTIYPARAAIVRDIASLTILPGRNEIILDSLTPNAEKNSIKVEARNTAGRITEMTVDLVPNPLYDPHENSSEGDEDYPPDGGDGAQALSLKATIKKEKEAIALLEDKEASYLFQHEMANEHLVSWATKAIQLPSNVMRKEYSAYHEFRSNIFSDLQTTRRLIAARKASVDAAERKLDQVVISESRSPAHKARAILKRERDSARLERLQTKPQTPEDAYRVRIIIELEPLPKGTTPSIAVDSTPRLEGVGNAEVPTGGEGGPSLRFSYVTRGASWTPRYDVQLDTIANMGVLTYGADIRNHTGETWEDARITLSTSQTGSSGLEHEAPSMDSWRVTLDSKRHTGQDEDGPLYSRKEIELRDVQGRKSDGPSEGSTTRTLTPSPSSLDGAIARIESYGLTTTYDLPGARTVIPRALPSRYIIAEHKLTDVTFSHHSVPKLCPSVFLKAHIRNRFPIALLRGPAGLSLDGTFLGTATIPFCAPGDNFELGLGVDESVLVGYRTPTRAVLSRQIWADQQVGYERCISIYNARKNGISLVVSDQVPVPITDSVEVRVRKPLDLKVGNSVKGAGAGIVVVCAPEMVVGELADAMVEMREGGEVRWEAKVEAGRRIMIALEYEVTFPRQNVIVEES